MNRETHGKGNFVDIPTLTSEGGVRIIIEIEYADDADHASGIYDVFFVGETPWFLRLR